MSAIANITVFDGAAAPVTHTLTARSVTRSLEGEVAAEWVERLPTVPDYASLSASVRHKRLKSGVVRTELRVELPVMETILNQNAAGYTAAPKVAYSNRITVVGFFSERSTVNDRRLVRQLVTNLLGNVSTSVVPVATGPAPELFDQLITPT